MPQRVSAPIELKPAQKQALDALASGRLRELTRGAYEHLTGMSRSQAAYDLADLVEAGVLERLGSGRSTRYRLPGRPDSGQRRWTRDAIRIELDRFCGDRPLWPSAHEFKAAGRADLYVAASRYGGVAFWAAELGFPRTPPASEPPRRIRRTVSFATAGAVFGAVAVATGVAIVWPNARPAIVSAPDPKIVILKPAPKRSETQQARHASIRRVAAPARRASTVHSSAARGAAQRVSLPAASAATERRTVSPSPPPAGPVPIPAPSAGSAAPAPLPSP